MTEKEICTMNIFEKMMHVTADASPLKRDLQVVQGSRGYATVSEKAVLEIIRPLEERYRIYSYPAERSCTTKTLKKEYQGEYGPWYENLFVNQITVKYRFVNVDNPSEYIEVMSFGTGIDSYDKAPGKGMTYADKYALIKAYKLYGEDPKASEDPDIEGSPDHGFDSVAPDDSEEVAIKKENHAEVEIPKEASQRQNVQPIQQKNLQVESARENQKPAPSSGGVWLPPGIQNIQKEAKVAISAPATQAPGKNLVRTSGEMTLEEAKAFVIPLGRVKGMTVGEALVRDRKALNFYGSDSFKNQKYDDLKKAVRMVLDSL